MIEALGTVGEALGADMALLGVCDDGAAGPATVPGACPDAWTPAAVWTRPGQSRRAETVLAPDCAGLPWVGPALARDTVVRLSRPEAAPPDLRALADHLAARGVRSVLALPLLHRGALAGAVAFVTLCQTRPWSDWDVRFAGLAAEILGQAMLRERLEHARAASEDRFRALFHQSREPLFLLDQNARLLDANPAAEAVVGSSRRTMMEREIEDTVSMNGRPLRRAELRERLAALEPGRLGAMEVVQHRDDGTAVPLELTARRFEHSGRPLYLLSALDISARKAAEAARIRRMARDELMLAVAKRFVRESLETATASALADVGLFLSLDLVLVQEPQTPDAPPVTRFAWQRDPARDDLHAAVAALPKARLGLEVGRPWQWRGAPARDGKGESDGEGDGDADPALGDLALLAAPVRVEHRVVAQVILAVRTQPAHDWRDEDRRLLAFLCEMYAIAVSRLHERNARADSEHRLEAFASNLPGAVWRRVLLPDGRLRYTYISGGLQRLLSVDPAEALHDPAPLLAVIHPEDRAGMMASVQHSARTLRDWVREFRIVDREGRLLWVHASGKVERLPDGSVAWDGITLDISARKRSEQALRESETRFRTAFNEAAEGMALIGPEGRWLRVNQSLAALLGAAPDAVIGTPVTAWVGRADRAALRRLRRALVRDPAAVTEIEVRLRRPDGAAFWVRGKAAPVLDADGRLLHLVAHVQDVSAQRATQALLVRARDQAEATARAKSEFLALMSHEIRTPLAGMIGLAQLLQREGLTAPQARRAGRIEAAGRLLLGMIDDILTLSKAEAGGVAVTHEPFAPASLLAEVLGLLSVTAEDKGLRLSMALDPAVPARLHGPAAAIRQVLFNLVGNAVKFTEAGQIVVRAQAGGPDPDDAPTVVTGGEAARRAVQPPAPTDGADPAWLTVAVDDTGIGVAPGQRTAIFEPFSQGPGGDRPAVRRATGRGVGLGLAICRRMVAAMGGDIGVTSTPEEGSRFWFTVPVRAAVPLDDATASPDGTPDGTQDAEIERDAATRPADAEPEAGAPATARPTEARPTMVRPTEAPAGRPRVLVVDDDDVNREVLESTLDALGCAAVGFADGATLLRAAGDGGLAVPDLILMDLNMPAPDGAETTRQLGTLGRAWARVPVLGVTAGAGSCDGGASAAPPGMRACLRKPVDPAVLHRLLARWIAADLGADPPAAACAGGDRDADVDAEAETVLDPSVWARRLATLGHRRVARRLADLRVIGDALRAWAAHGSPEATDLTPAEAAAHAHRIRGAAGILGAPALAAAAAALETALETPETPGTTPAAPQAGAAHARAGFVRAWDAAIAAFDDALARGAAG
nr:PAS domain S-box protein [Roseospira goensis]